MSCAYAQVSESLEHKQGFERLTMCLVRCGPAAVFAQFGWAIHCPLLAYSGRTLPGPSAGAGAASRGERLRACPAPERPSRGLAAVSCAAGGGVLALS